MKPLYSKYSFQKARVVLLVLLTVLFACMIYRLSLPEDLKQVVVNEVCSNNFSLLQDENGRYSDYIELYNASDQRVSMDGCFLSDDENQLEKYPLNGVVLAPKEYYVVWLDGRDDVDAGKIGFKISKFGDKVFLSNADAEEIIDSVEVPALTYNTGYGRVKDGEPQWRMMDATPGASNNEAEVLPLVELKDPVFSVESGFYDAPFELTITAGENEVIYYTLDGSDPTAESFRYTAPVKVEDASSRENVYAARTDLSPTRTYVPPFKVDKATILRAVSINERDQTASRIVSKVYFVGYDKREEYDSLPVVSLVTDPDNLFDMKTGIYGNGEVFEEYKEQGGLQDGELLHSFIDEEGEEHRLYMASNAFQDGREWERNAAVTYFDAEHNYCFTQNAGIRIAGQSTRATPKKSFSLYGRDIYDENVVFPYDFFPESPYATVKLRNGGNNNSELMFQDAFLEELAKDRNVSIQRSTPCVLFLNGEYWGIYNIRERYKEEYFKNHFDVNEDNVWLIDARLAEDGNEEAQAAYQSMIDTVTECDLSYDDVYAMVCGLIDVQSLIDYCCIHFYIDNRDVSFGQNTALWRTAEVSERAYCDGRWRWMLYDLDVTLFEYDEDTAVKIKDSDLFQEPALQSLLDSELFRKQLCLTFMDIANTTYAYERVHKKLMEWKEIYQAQMIKGQHRFFDEDFTEEDFDVYIAQADDFFRRRLPYAANDLKEALELTGSLETVAIHTDASEGRVMVNTASAEGDWSGQYFTDYPVSLQAIPEKGYRFAGWQGDVTGLEEELEVSIPAGGLEIQAIFEKAD